MLWYGIGGIGVVVILLRAWPQPGGRPSSLERMPEGSR